LSSSFLFTSFLPTLYYSYLRWIPLSIAGHDTLCSDSFHVSDVSLVPNLTMQLMSTGQITDHDFWVILDHDFCYNQDHHTGHLVGTSPAIVIHNIFGRMT
jgi:hypothetical protein